MIQPITFAQGKHILDTVPGSTLVDVRTEDEYGAEHAAGAVLLCAIFAVGVGGCLFAQRAGWARLIRFVAHPGWGSVAAVALAAGLIAFVAVEPGAVRRWGRRRK